MMPDIWREMFLLHGRTPEYRGRIHAAEAVVTAALRSHTRPVVAFSGGKDSLVTAHLVLRQRSDVLVYHWWTGPYMMPDAVEDEVRRNAREIGALNFRWGTSSRYTDPGVSPETKEKLFNTAYLGGVMRQFRADGYDVVFVGLRAEESNKRARRVRNHVGLGLMDEVHPVGWLTWMDIWAYIVSNALPYHSLYDVQAPVIGYDRARFGSFFAEKHHAFGTEAVQGVALWRLRGKGH